MSQHQISFTITAMKITPKTRRAFEPFYQDTNSHVLDQKEIGFG